MFQIIFKVLFMLQSVFIHFLLSAAFTYVLLEETRKNSLFILGGADVFE